MADDPLLLLRDRVIRLEARQDQTDARIDRIIKALQTLHRFASRMRKEKSDG
jgi:hypothetical protein